MARTVEQIKQSIIDQKNAESELSGLNSPSATAIYNLWAFITAVAINLHEQFIDQAILDIEQVAREAVPGTADWLQNRTLEFQYNELDPQVITVIDGKATYPTIDESLRIVTRAAVKEQTNSRVLVKVAKGSEVLEPLEPDQKSALIGYLSKISFVGIPIDLISLEADQFRFEGEIFYSGEFVETVVKEAIIEALKVYLSSVSINNFDGKIVREKVIDAIQAVAGVVGVDTLNVKLNGRPDTDAIGGPLNEDIKRTYETAAGYVVEETTSGSTFEDTITMTLLA